MLKGGKENNMDLLWEVVENAPIFMPKRRPTSEYDFGDTRTIWLKLKRAGKNITNFEDHDFGRFLGPYKGKWYVGTYGILTINCVPSRLEEFDTLEALKLQWQLD